MRRSSMWLPIPRSKHTKKRGIYVVFTRFVFGDNLMLSRESRHPGTAWCVSVGVCVFV